MKTEKEEACLIDTNVLFYAFDQGIKGKKKALAKALIEDFFIGENEKAFVPTQVLAEFYSITSKKLKNPRSLEKCREIISQILAYKNIIKLSYTEQTLAKAMLISEKYKKHFWDSLIVATMQEAGIQRIYTENIKDFEGVPGIVPINPFLS